ncbi:MAG: heme exporter protein CcmB [Flavobacteriales bacterium]|nr:heme exporter protein CcmB [Flavobacteriales bacterium]
MPSLTREIRHLIVKEFHLEWKNKNTIMGILLYVVSTIFVCYITFQQVVDISTWNALFWIIMLFASINAVSKGFLQESEGRQLYYYSLASAEAIILSKIIYNTLLMIVLALISFMFYSLFLRNIVEDVPWFLLGVIAGSAGLASAFTMVSAIAYKANNNGVLVAILGFPLILPLMLVIIKFSNEAMVGVDRMDSTGNLLIISLLNLIIMALSYLLFPYLWRD